MLGALVVHSFAKGVGTVHKGHLIWITLVALAGVDLLLAGMKKFGLAIPGLTA